MKEQHMKPFYIKLSEEDRKLLEIKSKERNLDRTNYIRYLIRNDRLDRYSDSVVIALDCISSTAEKIINVESENPELKSLCNDLERGVQQLWQSLQ